MSLKKSRSRTRPVTKRFLPAAQKAIDDNGGYIAGRFNKAFSITGEPPANRVVILQYKSLSENRLPLFRIML
jgi:hypothetical protein